MSLSNKQINHFARQLILKDFGEKKQKILFKTHITFIGIGGIGGHSVGDLAVIPGQILEIYVGGQGTSGGGGLACNIAGGWNGGGSGYASSSGEPGNGGGGATDVRTVNGSWNDATSLASRVIVAGGGGGGEYSGSNAPGAGDGLHGGQRESLKA